MNINTPEPQNCEDWASKFEPRPLESESHQLDLYHVREAFKSLAIILQDRLPIAGEDSQLYRDRVLLDLESAAMFSTKCFTHSHWGTTE